jgi:hypothetical protein
VVCQVCGMGRRKVIWNEQKVATSEVPECASQHTPWAEEVEILCVCVCVCVCVNTDLVSCFGAVYLMRVYCG